MRSRLRSWTPMALCLLPAFAVAALVGVTLLAGGGLTSTVPAPLALGVLAAAFLACPAGMLMMRRSGTTQSSTGLAPCCLPEEMSRSEAAGSSRDGRSRASTEPAEAQAAPSQAR